VASDNGSIEPGGEDDTIDPAPCSLSYISVDDIVTTIAQGALIAKSDIKQAYRQITVNPQD
jgi:hypothetical protein